MLEDFEELDRAYQKSKKVIEAEGFPRFVVRCLVDLEDFVGEIWDDKDARKKMSKLNSKGVVFVDVVAVDVVVVVVVDIIVEVAAVVVAVVDVFVVMTWL